MNGVAKMPKLGMQSIRRRQLIDATLEAINEAVSYTHLFKNDYLSLTDTSTVMAGEIHIR